MCAAGEDQGDRLCCTSSRSSTACQEQRPICLASRTSPRHSVCSSSSLRVLPLSPRHARQHAHCRTVPVEPDFCRRAEWGLGLHAGGFETSMLPVHATEHHRPSPPPRCHVRSPLHEQSVYRSPTDAVPNPLCSTYARRVLDADRRRQGIFSFVMLCFNNVHRGLLSDLRMDSARRQYPPRRAASSHREDRPPE